MTDHTEPTRYFVDTEFIEDGATIDLVSIGVACEDGREWYCEVAGVDWSKASDWVLANVKPHLLGATYECSRATIAAGLLKFVNHGASRPEFWAYYGDYDWVAVCQLYGTMMDLPSGWPMFCMDLKQLAVSMGDPALPEQTGTEHNALNDARWVRDTHAWLNGARLRSGRPGGGEPQPGTDDECPQSQRVDGPLHSWRFDGDDPYIVCVFCGERRDARTGRVVTPAPVRSAGGGDQPDTPCRLCDDTGQYPPPGAGASAFPRPCPACTDTP